MPNNLTGLSYVGIDPNNALNSLGATGSPYIGGTIIQLTSTSAITLSGFLTPSATVRPNTVLGVLVKVDASNNNSVVETAATGDVAIGALIGTGPRAIGTSPKAGQLGIIQITGIVALVASGSISGGGLCCAAASGAAIAQTSTDPVIGVALNTVTNGQTVYVLLGQMGTLYG